MSRAVDAAVWNIELLRRLDWRGFELLCADIFREAGYQVEDTGRGEDGGIDLICQQANVTFAVQCKRHKNPICMKEVRDFFGSMALRDIPSGVFITTGTFNKRARDQFRKQPGLELVDGEMTLQGIAEFPDATQQRWVKDYTEIASWDHPTCPSCDIKMVVREGAQQRFWGCPNYGSKNCRQTFEERAFPFPDEGR